MTKLTTLHQAREAYLAHLLKQGKKETTITTYGKDFDLIEDFLGADRKLGDIKPGDVGRFIHSDDCLKLPSGKPRAKPTTDKTIRVLRMFLVWAKETGRLKEAPLPADMPMGRDGPKPKKAKKDPKVKPKKTEKKT